MFLAARWQAEREYEALLPRGAKGGGMSEVTTRLAMSGTRGVEIVSATIGGSLSWFGS